MGSLFGKPQKKNVKSAVQVTSRPPVRQQNYEIFDPEKYHKEAVAALRAEFRDDPDTFILNQILMTMMFFDDYQEEMRLLANTVSERAQRLNSQLIQKHQKQLLMPDVVMESVNRRVKYLHPKKSELEPLVSQRMFILHDTIEIEDNHDSGDYSRIDKLCYRAELEESPENKGFVQVHLLGTSEQGLKEKRESADSACSTTSVKWEASKVGNGSKNPDSGFSTESDYEYSRITYAKTPRRIQIAEKDIYTSISQLPSKCITAERVKKDVESDFEDDEEDEEARRKRKMQEETLYLIRYYLNSTEFMSHFKDNVFPHYLGEVLDFDEGAIEKAMSILGAVYCDSSDDLGNYLQYEILPAIGMRWPDRIAYEWPIRARVTVYDRNAENPTAYKWPTPKMVENVRNLSCVVTPKGFMPKKGSNTRMHTEWEVCFPKAERFLELRMSHAQMRAFLYILTLYKTFIEPKTQKQGLLVEHIRMFMFWECEANYKTWPEDKLGIKLKLLLQSLYDHLSKRHLSHYFIRSKNVLENIPGNCIMGTLETINQILESPVSYVLFALRHLKYTPGKFYPEPNFDELYEILTSQTTFSSETFITIIAQQQAKMTEENKKRKEGSGNKTKRDKEDEWNRRQLEIKRHAYERKLMSGNSGQTENLNQEPRLRPKSMNFEIPLKKQFQDNSDRQRHLLTFFIKQYLQIAKKSLRISSTKQTLFYLKQAWYLTKLLEDIDPENALEIQKSIKEEEENCQKKKAVEPKIPSTPQRNSIAFSNEILQVKSKEINIKNLNKSYSANILAHESKPSTSGVKKKGKRQNMAEVKTNVLEKQPRVVLQDQNGIETITVNHNVQLRHSRPPIEITKSLSFKTSSDHVDIVEQNEEPESTSL